MTTEKLENNITEYLESLRSSELLFIYSEFCSAANYRDDEIFSMDDFEEIVCGWKPLELAQRIFYGDFNPNHNYFYFNGYGNLVSTDYPADLVSIPDIAAYIIENDDELFDDEIREMLDEYNESEEEEE
jgi:hypothetical protein